VLIVRVVAALLLLLGSGLIFRALVEIDASARPRANVRRRPLPREPEREVDLPRAA
jgi:hypothetical protein